MATQDPELRKRFTGDPDHVVNFFRFIVQELREIMAELGFRTVNEMIGQADFLEMREGIDSWKFKNVDLSAVVHKASADEPTGFYQTEKQEHEMADVLDWKLLKAAEPAIANGTKVQAEFAVCNTDRTVGTILSNEITRKYKAAGLPDDTLHFNFKGTAGQSFGAFNCKGITLELEGDANDYFGKGLSGARLLVYPPKESPFVPEDNIIIGNVALYLSLIHI